MNKERVIISISKVRLKYTYNFEVFATISAQFQKKDRPGESWYDDRCIKWRSKLKRFPLKPIRKPKRLTNVEFEEVRDLVGKLHKDIISGISYVVSYYLSSIRRLPFNINCKNCCKKYCNSCKRR